MEKSQFEKRQDEVNEAAKALCKKLGGLPWQDRHIGFEEWRRLTNAIEALESGPGKPF